MPVPSQPDTSGWLKLIGGQWLPATRFAVAQILDTLEVSKDTRRAARPTATIDVTDLLTYEERSHAEFRTDVEHRLRVLIDAEHHVNIPPLYRHGHQLMLHVSLEDRRAS